MFKHLFPATLVVMLLGAAPALAGSFFGPCCYGLDYYRQYPQRTYLRKCRCCPPKAPAPAQTPPPPVAAPAPAAAPSHEPLPAPTQLPPAPAGAGKQP